MATASLDGAGLSPEKVCVVIYGNGNGDTSLAPGRLTFITKIAYVRNYKIFEFKKASPRIFSANLLGVIN